MLNALRRPAAHGSERARRQSSSEAHLRVLTQPIPRRRPRRTGGGCSDGMWPGGCEPLAWPSPSRLRAPCAVCSCALACRAGLPDLSWTWWVVTPHATGRRSASAGRPALSWRAGDFEAERAKLGPRQRLVLRAQSMPRRGGGIGRAGLPACPTACPTAWWASRKSRAFASVPRTPMPQGVVDSRLPTLLELSMSMASNASRSRASCVIASPTTPPSSLPPS